MASFMSNEQLALYRRFCEGLPSHKCPSSKVYSFKKDDPDNFHIIHQNKHICGMIPSNLMRITQDVLTY